MSEMINKDRMNRKVKCLNIDHELLAYITDQQIPKCPICDRVMVTVVKSVVKIVKNELVK